MELAANLDLLEVLWSHKLAAADVRFRHYSALDVKALRRRQATSAVKRTGVWLMSNRLG